MYLLPLEDSILIHPKRYISINSKGLCEETMLLMEKILWFFLLLCMSHKEGLLWMIFGIILLRDQTFAVLRLSN